MLAGFLAFIAPCGGSSGLPKLAARAFAAVIATPVVPAALAARISRLDIMARCSLGWMDGGVARSRSTLPHCGLTRTGIDLAAGVLLFRSWWAKGSNGLVSG